MRKSLLFSFFLFIYTIGFIAQENTTVDCNGGPITTTFCYDTGLDNSYSFISSDGGPLNLVIDSGEVESGWDELKIATVHDRDLLQIARKEAISILDQDPNLSKQKNVRLKNNLDKISENKFSEFF